MIYDFSYNRTAFSYFGILWYTYGNHMNGHTAEDANGSFKQRSFLYDNFSCNILLPFPQYHKFSQFSLSPLEVFWLPEYFGLFQFELFIWNTMRQKQTPMCRNGMWQCWNWAATNTTSNGPSSCTFGKPLTSMYFYTLVFMYIFWGGGL